MGRSLVNGCQEEILVPKRLEKVQSFALREESDWPPSRTGEGFSAAWRKEERSQALDSEALDRSEAQTGEEEHRAAQLGRHA